MIKKIVLVLLALALFLAAAVWWALQQTEQWLTQPLSVTETRLLTVPAGSNYHSVIHQLESQHWIQDSRVKKLVPRLHPNLIRVKKGTYQIEPGLTLEHLLNTLVSGQEHQFSMTFIEGSTFAQWRDTLKASPHIKHTLTGLEEAQIAQKLGLETDKVEGWLLPETYHYTEGTTDLAILIRAQRKLSHALEQAWQQKQSDLPLNSPYQALILASIIEKETAIDSERGTVASVFVNRLRKGMRLQTDPTVIYGMGSAYDGNITRKDLRQPTPYNTYVINGLPPTPIAMVSAQSIQAALNPQQTPYYYFVATGNGGHRFSTTLAEHNRAVRAYLKELKKK